MRLFGEIGTRDRHAETMGFSKFDPAGEQHLPDMEDPHIERRDLEMNADMAVVERDIELMRGQPPVEEIARPVGRTRPLRDSRIPMSGHDATFDSLETGVVDWFRDEAQLDDPNFSLARQRR